MKSALYPIMVPLFLEKIVNFMKSILFDHYIHLTPALHLQFYCKIPR